MAILLGNIASTIGDNTDMSRSENINKWSARKFVRHSSRSKLTDAQMKEVNYGWKIPVFTKSQLVSGTTQNDRMWKYETPRSGVDPSRMGDMEGYNHYARRKWMYFTKDGKNYELYLDETPTFRLEMTNDGNSSTGSILLSNVKSSSANSLIGLEVVLVFFDTNSNGYDYATHVLRTGTTMAENYVTSSIKVSHKLGFTAGTKKKIGAFLCTSVSSLTTGVITAISSASLGNLIPLAMEESKVDLIEPTYSILARRPAPVENMFLYIGYFSVVDWRAEQMTFYCSSYEAETIQFKFDLYIKRENGTQEYVSTKEDAGGPYTWTWNSNTQRYEISIGSVSFPAYSGSFSTANGDNIQLIAYIKSVTATAYTQVNDLSTAYDLTER